MTSTKAWDELRARIQALEAALWKTVDKGCDCPACYRAREILEG